MNAFRPVLVTILALTGVLYGDDYGHRAWELESQGDAAAARELLQKAAQASPNDFTAQLAYAEFLDRHRDPSAREVYARILDMPGSDRRRVARRLVTLDLLADDRNAAVRHLEVYRAAGGSGLTLPAAAPSSVVRMGTVQIPGPLGSFARMAALSPDLPPDDLLSALARNIVTNGYQATNSAEGLDQTEYLKLVVRYLSQARELEKIAGQAKVIDIETCESSQTADLLRVLGYRMRGGCGSDVVLETVNATRAFLTIDSGFPLAELEQALRTNRPFKYDFHPTEIPVLYGADYWYSAREKPTGDFVDYFISDPALCRLYLGLSKLEPDTAEELRRTMPVQRLKAYAHVLDFFGGMFEIRDGKAVVPGGGRSERAWADLVGANPDKGANFFEKLIAKDDGWLAGYFDSLARISGPTQAYLAEPDRLKRFYAAIRGKVTSPGPARPVFRSNTDLMLLTTRLRIDSDGRPHVPGNLEIWKNLFVNHPHGKYDSKLSKAATGWKDADDVLEALFALCRKAVENEPLKIFMALSDLDRHRTAPLQPETVDRLAREYRRYGSQYSIFGEVPAVSDKTILSFLDTAEAATRYRDPLLRSDTAGTLQALAAIWQILCRQGSISPAQADSTLAAILTPFGKVKNAQDVFDAGRSGVQAILASTGLGKGVSVQDRMLDLLAGTGAPSDSEAHSQVIQDEIRIFEAQRLISLELIFDLADNFDEVSKGKKIDIALVNKIAARIGEIQMPRASLSTVEKNSLAFGYWSEKHIENQRKVNIRAAVEKAGNDPEKLRDIRGRLAPILRDTLVGFAYIHYAPPGAQILHTNPVFVRSHDFIGLQGANQTWKTTEVFGTGWPANAGGRLVGSLSGLPYALAEAEQNFLIPSREQALIWGDLVPQLLVSATVPRWWNVTPAQLHWVNLHMAYGESMAVQAALNSEARKRFVAELGDRAAPARARKVDLLLAGGNARSALENIMPAELFWIAAADLKSPQADNPLADDLKRMTAESPSELNYASISRAFGTPKPTLTNSYAPELLNLRTFPTLMGYSSRMLAESWESNLLYYAALADQVHVTPSQLNLMIPEWTQQTVERIFATHLEDWPALLRSLRLVGDDVRAKAYRQMTGVTAGGE
jgi:hypothetical protein